MSRLANVLCLLAMAAGAQQQQTSPDLRKGIEQQLRGLRSLADDVRAVRTRQLALEIRALPPSEAKVSLAMALSNLSTEGDFGRATLQEVAATLDGAIRESHAKPQAYAELARLVRYEQVNASLDDPQLSAALAKLD